MPSELKNRLEDLFALALGDAGQLQDLDSTLSLEAKKAFFFTVFHFSWYNRMTTKVDCEFS